MLYSHFNPETPFSIILIYMHEQLFVSFDGSKAHLRWNKMFVIWLNGDLKEFKKIFYC